MQVKNRCFEKNAVYAHKIHLFSLVLINIDSREWKCKVNYIENEVFSSINLDLSHWFWRNLHLRNIRLDEEQNTTNKKELIRIWTMIHNWSTTENICSSQIDDTDSTYAKVLKELLYELLLSFGSQNTIDERFVF